MSKPALWRMQPGMRWTDHDGNEIAPAGMILVERCEHGRLDPHKTQDSYLNFAGRFVPAEWCGGSPTLAKE